MLPVLADWWCRLRHAGVMVHLEYQVDLTNDTEAGPVTEMTQSGYHDPITVSVLLQCAIGIPDNEAAAFPYDPREYHVGTVNLFGEFILKA